MNDIDEYAITMFVIHAYVYKLTYVNILCAQINRILYIYKIIKVVKTGVTRNNPGYFHKI